MNRINPTTLSKEKIKPMIDFRIGIDWNTKGGIANLIKDQPKLITISNTHWPSGRDIGKKGMRHLCKTLRNAKNVKNMAISICESDKFRTLTKWLKSSRNLEALRLVVPWRVKSSDKDFFFYLKYVKSLNLTFEILSDWFIFPKMQLYRLTSLKKLKIQASIHRLDNSGLVSSILNGLKGLGKLGKLDELDLDPSFLLRLSDLKIQTLMRHLKEIKNLRCLRLDLSNFQGVSPFAPGMNNCYGLSLLAIQELSSYLSSLEKLESCYLRFAIHPSLSFEMIERLISSVKHNLGLKNLVLAETSEPNGEELQCLNLKTFNQLQSLKLTLSTNSKPISNRLLEDIAETLARNPQLEVLDFWFRFKPSSLQGYKLFCGSLQNLKNLLTLRLSFTQTEDSSDNEHIEALTEGLKGLKKLENLNLDFHRCALSNTSIARIAESVDSLQYLKVLYLDFNYPPPPQLLDKILFLRKSGVGSFGPVFGRHQNLSSITLLTVGLKITDQEYEELGQGIGALKTLKSFEFSSNHVGQSLNNLYQSLANSPVLSCLGLRLIRMKHQDLEDLFGMLRNTKNLEILKFDFLVQSLSERAVENFNNMIQGLTKLASMELSVDWSGNIDLNLILNFYNGSRYFSHYVDCDWNWWGRGLQEKEMCKNILKKNSKYLGGSVPFHLRYHSK